MDRDEYLQNLAAEQEEIDSDEEPREPTPSQTSDYYWIEVMNPTDRNSQRPDPKTNKGGKWVGYFGEDEIDSAWEIIKEDTLKGNLGYRAVVKTARPCFNKYDKIPEKPIFVSTSDYNDEAEKQRVLNRLNELGFQDKNFFYKTDQDSDDGKLYINGDKDISINKQIREEVNLSQFDDDD